MEVESVGFSVLHGGEQGLMAHQPGTPLSVDSLNHVVVVGESGPCRGDVEGAVMCSAGSWLMVDGGKRGRQSSHGVQRQWPEFEAADESVSATRCGPLRPRSSIGASGVLVLGSAKASHCRVVGRVGQDFR